MSTTRTQVLRRLAGAAATLGVLTGTVAVAPPASAYPGQNGRIAFVSHRDGSGADIFVMKPDGSSPTNLTKSPGVPEFQPAFSPDGKRIAFSSDSGGPFGLFVMNADGSNPKRITTFGQWPTWSPDGKRLAFEANSEIWAVNADGTNLVQLTNDPAPSYYPAWSPDGTRIAFERSWRVWTIGPDGSNPTELAEGLTPAWSPDGQKIAFAGPIVGDSDINIMNADGTNPINLPKPGTELSPTWSPDGKKIAFETLPADSIDYEIWVVNVDGSNPKNLTNNNAAGIRGADLSPDWGRTPALGVAGHPPIQPGGPPASTPPPWSAAAPRR